MCVIHGSRHWPWRVLLYMVLGICEVHIFQITYTGIIVYFHLCFSFLCTAVLLMGWYGFITVPTIFSHKIRWFFFKYFFRRFCLHQKENKENLYIFGSRFFLARFSFVLLMINVKLFLDSIYVIFYSLTYVRIHRIHFHLLWVNIDNLCTYYYVYIRLVHSN